LHEPYMDLERLSVPKINLRLGIILAVMCIVIFYGVYTWLTPSDLTTMAGVTDTPADKQVFIDTLTSGMGKEEDSLKFAYAVSMAETQWWNDPFLDRNQYRAWGQTKENEVVAAKEGAVKFAYTGFVEIKGRTMAIINGDEYSKGEKLLTNRHVLKSIDPAKVVIQDLINGQDMTVPFQE
jgi:hypothetical protein